MNEEILRQNEAIVNELIEGTNAYEPYYFDDLKEPIQMRKLSAKELKSLKKSEKKNVKSMIKIKKGQRSKEDIKEQMQDFEQEIDHEQLVENTEETKYLAINLSSNIPIETVERLPQKLVDDIFERIIYINNLTKEDLAFIENFRKNRESQNDVSSPNDGDVDK
jgi:hypothetical protein